MEAIEAYKLLKNQWKSAEEIKRIQNTKLKRFTKHAYEKVPYYRQLFDSIKLKPEEIQSIDDLGKIPLTSKETIRKLPLQHIIAKGININRCRISKTSGTTSTPFTIYRARQDAMIAGIIEMRALFAYGAKPWFKIMELSGDSNIPEKRKIFDHHCIWRRWLISTWEPIDSWIEKLQRWKPQIIWGFVLTLKLLAELILEKRITDINPSIILSGGGVLDQPTRNIINTAFRAKVFDYYSSWEAGMIAWECPECPGYHINSDMVILEVLKDGKPVSPCREGEVVVTNLHSHAMPFIRYRQGDEAALSSEEAICGRSFPLLKYIKGRLGDYVVLPSGKRVSPHLFARIISLTPGIGQYKFVQEEIDRLVIDIIPSGEFTQSHSTALEEELRKVVGMNMNIEISVVKKLKFIPSHKMKLIESKVIKKD